MGDIRGNWVNGVMYNRHVEMVIILRAEQYRKYISTWIWENNQKYI